LSLGIYNSAADVDYLLQHLPPIISELRAGAKHSRPAQAQKETLKA